MRTSAQLQKFCQRLLGKASGKMAKGAQAELDTGGSGCWGGMSINGLRSVGYRSEALC